MDFHLPKVRPLLVDYQPVFLWRRGLSEVSVFRLRLEATLPSCERSNQRLLPGAGWVVQDSDTPAPGMLARDHDRVGSPRLLTSAAFPGLRSAPFPPGLLGERF